MTLTDYNNALLAARCTLADLQFNLTEKMAQGGCIECLKEKVKLVYLYVQLLEHCYDCDEQTDLVLYCLEADDIQDIVEDIYDLMENEIFADKIEDLIDYNDIQQFYE